VSLTAFAARSGRDECLRPATEIDAPFALRRIAGARPVSVCRGDGIAATGRAFALTAPLGREDVAVCGASMPAWAIDPSAPTETS
jgi:3-mercaptopyruvate sulfurtransferase SseA